MKRWIVRRITKLAGKIATKAKVKTNIILKKTNHELRWAGPVILMFLGFVWLLHGYGLLPSPFNVQWLGGILLALGFARLVMYRLGYY